MSYASVAAHDAPPPSLQPHADPALLNTSPATTSNLANDSAKISVVSSDFKSHPSTTYTSEGHTKLTVDGEHDDFSADSTDKTKTKEKSSRAFKEAEAEGTYLWDVAKHFLIRPGVAGGFLGLLNVGIMAGVGHAYYTQPHFRHDKTIIGSTIAGTLALVSVEGYAAEKFRQTPRGQDEECRAKEEGALIYRHAREIILRPGVLGGLLGLVNTAILGTIGYYGYINWDKPSWDRRTVSSISVGLFTLWGGEEYLAELYRESRH